MPKPRCRDCRSKRRPLRWRALFDAWLRPQCEKVAAKDAAAQLLTEISW